MKKLIQICLMGSIFCLSNIKTAESAEYEADWVNVNNYDDIRSGEQNRLAFQKQVISSFNKHFKKLANKLPDNQTLKLKILNVDLAGEINFMGSRQVRVIKDLYIPRISLSYQLVDEKNEIISANEVNLKNMNFMHVSHSRYKNQFLGHEKLLLDNWFEYEFKK